MTNRPTHQPVLVERVVALLAPALSTPGSVYVDATLGLAGHASAILEHCPGARLLGLDRDRQALALAAERLAPFGDRVTLVEAVFDELPEVLAAQGLTTVAAINFDFGLSSLQIDDRQRGFAYAADAPLDMRMSPETTTVTAADLVNQASASQLAGLFRRAADERFAGRIAAAIVAEREQAPFTSSARLVSTITAAVPAQASGGHPAKRVFQALRMAVNDETETLHRALPAALKALAVGGRISLLSYHSGEDRFVKRTLAAAAQDRVPPGLVVVPDHLRAEFRLLTAGAERPTAAEQAANPRSASARLRAAERIQEAA
ncbi:MAG: 16S rRNA (cytosine(1402)-N(4))-methyltransferase RsmH [Propionibacteriaceae bacterium]|jgi:16S rRNA (cytosine1402-N4)-methyltransferase|nr:16S rRNA (cytosine(1402)-N(4))-methyltransferase RsmH [Propionibacteriaceae bacterium]